MAAVLSKEEKKGLRQNEEKWTLTLMKPGWTVIPSIILERQRALGLEPIDVNIIMHLVRHWWFAGKLPFPTKKSIAECMGVHESTVRRRIAAMENAGFIKRIPRFDKEHGQKANEYNFDGLIKEVTPYAKEWIVEQNRRHQENAERRTRKRLKLVKAEPDDTK